VPRLSRRQFLRDSTGLAAALVAGPVSFKGCREDAPILAAPEGAPPGEGGVCAATVASTAPPPVRAPLHPDAIASLAGETGQATAAALLTLALEDVVVEGPPGFFRRRKPSNP